VTVKPAVKHILSKELQLYFDKITNAIRSPDKDRLARAALNSLSSDPGIHQLLPYLSQFVSDEVCYLNLPLLLSFSLPYEDDESP
jgi:transcription initiation factor TFIID subunit 6